MAAAIILEAGDVAALDAVMASLVAGAHDTQPLMERLGIVGEDSVSENFEGEHDPQGVPWKPSFRAEVEGGKTLTDNAILANLIESRATADQVEIGTNLIYARIHQEGGTIRGNPHLRFALPGGLGFATVESVTIPARPFLGWGRSAIDEAELQGEEYLASLMPPGALS